MGYVVVCQEGIMSLYGGNGSASSMLIRSEKGTIFFSKSQAQKAIKNTLEGIERDDDNEIYSIWKSFQDYEDVNVFPLVNVEIQEKRKGKQKGKLYCSRCGRIRNRSEFYRKIQEDNISGSYCIDCFRQIAKEYREKKKTEDIPRSSNGTKRDIDKNINLLQQRVNPENIPTMYPKNWNDGVVQKEIRDRESNICIICGISNDEHFKIYGHSLHVHHINADKSDFNRENLTTLCKSCHQRVHFKKFTPKFKSKK